VLSFFLSFYSVDYSDLCLFSWWNVNRGTSYLVWNSQVSQYKQIPRSKVLLCECIQSFHSFYSRSCSEAIYWEQTLLLSSKYNEAQFSCVFERKKTNTSTILDKNPFFCVYNLFVIICHWRLGLEGHVLLRKNIFGREKCTGGPYTCPALSYVLLKYRSRPITSISKK